MASATNQDAYGNPWGNQWGNQWGPGGGQGGGPRGGQGDGPGWLPPPPPWRAPWQDGWLSGPMGIAAMVLGFIFFWPVGLAILFYLLGTGRMGCRRRWRREAQQAGWNGPEGFAAWKSWMCGPSGGGRAAPSSGNHAFDEYRAETLRRLEEEQKEFSSFLERLRFARDKAEFDQFMAERRSRPTSGDSEQPAA